MIRKLYRHEIDFDKAMDFVKWTIAGNKLSLCLLELLDLKNGKFFTLLPKKANLEGINQFRYGGILPQNPINKYKGKTYQVIPNLEEEICLYLMKILKKDHFNLIVDDFNETYNEKIVFDHIFSSFGLIHNKEVYYGFSFENQNKNVLLKILRRSNTFWHSLSILTKTNFDDIIDKKLTVEKIEEICTNAKMLIIGAYDGEGYIFWEKTEKSNSKNPKTRKTKSISKKKSQHSV